MRRYRILAIMLVIFLFICACEADQVTNSEPFLAAELTGSLDVALGANHNEDGSMGFRSFSLASGPLYDRLRAFIEKQSELDIHYREINYARNYPPLVSLDQFPDIIELVPYQVQWVLDDELEPLEYIFPLSKWPKAYADLIERLNANSSVYLLPLKIEPLVAYYDEQVFRLLDISLPHDSWTWEDFVAASRQLDANGYSVDIPDTFATVEPIIRGLGGAYLPPDRSMFSEFLDSEATIEAFTEYVTTLGPIYERQSTRSGHPVLGIQWPSRIYPRLLENRDLRIARLPIFPDGARHNTMFATGIGMSSASKNMTAAVALIEALINRDEQELIRFVNYHGLTSKQPRYRTAPPGQLEQLLSIMEQETAVAIPSSSRKNTYPPFDEQVLLRELSNGVYLRVFGMEHIHTALQELASYADSVAASDRGNFRW